MITAELTLNKSIYITRLFKNFILSHYAENYTLDNSFIQADNSDIIATLNGNGNAFAELIKRYQNKIAAKMWRFTRDRQKLEELVQEVFIETYKSLQSFKQGSPFLPWVMKIAIRVGYRHWNKAVRISREISLDKLDEIITNGNDIKPNHAAEMIHILLGTLAPKDRLVLMLIYFEGCSIAEVAELTGWSRLMVKVRAHRARGKLKRLIEKEMTKE